jgi:hypothetical protein
MGIIRTTASLLLSCRHVTDRDVDPSLVDNTHVLPVLNEALRELYLLCAKLRPLEYGAVSNSFTIASGNTFNIAAGGADGVAQTAYMDLVALEWSADAGAHWRDVDKATFTRRNYRGRAGYVLRERTLVIYPPESANLYPFRYWYAKAPAALVNGGESVDLPFGGDQYLVQHVAALLIRPRYEEDSTMHFAAKKSAEDAVRRDLAAGPPEVIRSASDEDEDVF